MARIGAILCHWLNNVAALMLLSTVMLFTFVGVAAAHEIRPAIADVELTEERIEIELRFTAETLLAGINLDGLEDTNEAPEADQYDALRAEPGSVVAGKMRNKWSSFRNGVIVKAGNETIMLDLISVRVDEIGDPELPRDSFLTLSAPLPRDGSTVQIGWIAAYGPLIIRQAEGGDDAYAGFLDKGALSEPLPRTGTVSEPASSVFLRYIWVGFDHIVPKGLDHILFVLGLFLLSTRIRPLLTQITIFTVAHTITLALAASGVVSISAAIVEPLIALSIVYVAIENVFTRKLTPWRPFIIFVFGLLHGLGFASVLGEFGLAPGRFVSALVGFNIGVEVGQIAVVATAFLLVGLWFGRKPWYRKVVSIPASLVIAAIGAYWAVERAFF
jgi:hypothetical protein